MSKIKFSKRLSIILLCVALITGGCSTGKKKTALDPKNPVTVTVWNYYNGDQLAAFEALVEKFNATIGSEKGIVVVNVSQGDINTLADELIASAEGQAGSQELPVLAAVYAETAFILNEAGALEPLDEYFTKDELKTYVPGFIDEGRFSANNELLLFPIIKSTEIFSANETDWQPFFEFSGISIESITTKQALSEAAKAYYEYTDALTPDIPEDGKALYGRDSMANYIYIGSYQLGHKLFKLENGKLTLDMDRDVFKILWDNYYIPYINGYFASYAKFRSEDCKTGKILALTSSSSSVSYLPTAVTTADDTTHDITTYISVDIPFEGAVNNAVVQQGASYCMLKSTPAQMEGAVEFVKWFTASEQNLDFATRSGYSPVTVNANTKESITSAYSGDVDSPKGKNVFSALLVSADAFGSMTSYATKPFNGSKDVRSIIENTMKDIAAADRASVVEAINSGESREQAVARFITDEYFDAWFDGLCQKVNDVINK